MPEDRPVELPEGVVRTDRYDRRVYAGIRSASDALREVEAAAAEKLPAAPVLMADLWAGLYKASPALRDDLPSSLALNRQLLEQAMRLPEWEDLRAATRLDEWSSALGTLSVGPKLLENVPDDAKKAFEEAAEAEKQARKWREKAEAFAAAAQELMDAGREEEASSMRQKSEEAQGKAERKAAQAAKAASAAAEALDSPQVRKAVRQAVKSGLEEAGDCLEAASQLMPGWGTGAGAAQMVEREEKFKLAVRLRTAPKLREIARLTGRMTRIALAKRRTRVLQDPSEITDVEIGSDLGRVLPAELSLLSHSVLRKDFLRRFAEGKLLQYRLDGKAPEGRGPIVACLDSSGSMAGENEVWSKAVALALFQIAFREKRAFACVHFGNAEEIRSFEFPDPRQAKPNEIADMAAFFFGGGTDFEAPLRAAMDVMKKSAFKKGDIVFITDGACAVSEEFCRELTDIKAEKGFSVFSVVMPGGSSASVEVFSDRVARAEPGDDQEALEIAFGM